MIKITDEIIKIPKRDGITNKGDAGHVLIIGGNIGMCGAVAFATESAYRSGCGLVRACVHPDNRIPVQILVPEAVLTFWEDDLEESIEWADAIVIGVGFGIGEIQKKLLKKVINTCDKPIVIDADGLNILSKSPTLISHLSNKTVLTPHLAELSRLSGVSIADIKEDTFKVLRENMPNVTVAAKSDVTRIRFVNGDEYISSSGDSSLSTGGTGDILAGMIGSFIAQGLPVSDAVVSAVYLHGRAGETAGECLGQHGVIARDVIEQIPCVIKNESTE